MVVRTLWLPNAPFQEQLLAYDDADTAYDDVLVYYNSYNPNGIREDGSIPTNWTPAS